MKSFLNEPFSFWTLVFSWHFTSIFLIIFCVFVIVSYWLILFKKSPFIIEFEHKFYMKANFLFRFTTSKLYVLLLILADCFSTLPVKGTLRIWLFWRDFGKSQIRNTYNLLSFPDSLFRAWKYCCAEKSVKFFDQMVIKWTFWKLLTCKNTFCEKNCWAAQSFQKHVNNRQEHKKECPFRIDIDWKLSSNNK